jgi:hypothetical protein
VGSIQTKIIITMKQIRILIMAAIIMTIKRMDTTAKEKAKMRAQMRAQMVEIHNHIIVRVGRTIAGSSR